MGFWRRFKKGKKRRAEEEEERQERKGNIYLSVKNQQLIVEVGKDGEVYLSVSPGYAKIWSGEDIQNREERKRLVHGERYCRKWLVRKRK